MKRFASFQQNVKASYNFAAPEIQSSPVIFNAVGKAYLFTVRKQLCYAPVAKIDGIFLVFRKALARPRMHNRFCFEYFVDIHSGSFGDFIIALVICAAQSEITVSESEHAFKMPRVLRFNISFNESRFVRFIRLKPTAFKKIFHVRICQSFAVCRNCPHPGCLCSGGKLRSAYCRAVEKRCFRSLVTFLKFADVYRNYLRPRFFKIFNNIFIGKIFFDKNCFDINIVHSFLHRV